MRIIFRVVRDEPSPKRISRRGWLAGAAVVTAALPFGAWLAHDRRRPLPPPTRFGALRPDPDGILDLLEGFRYRVIERSGDRMSDGLRVPRRPDGMACFALDDDTLVLMRNHELPGGLAGRLFGLPEDPSLAYDAGSAGGVTRVVLDARTLEKRSSNFVLAGTTMNCAGGPSPWGWLSCEESVDEGHGFVFLCDPAAESLRAPVRIDALGRFRHEAAAVHPERLVMYASEDQHDGGLYRFVPHDPSAPFEGRLQALRVRGRAGVDTGAWRAGERVEIDWIDLDDPTPRQDDLRHRARAAGAAQFRRGEGLAFGGGGLYLAATVGGPIGSGQIFRLEDEGDGGTLEVIAASTDRDALDMPDNITVAPNGAVFFVEDGADDNYLRGIAADGEVFDVARNATGLGEFAGVCFAPDGRAMFVNIQEAGLTLAIEGPFDRLV